MAPLQSGNKQMVVNLIRRGLVEYQAGRLQEAKRLYEQALAMEPRNPDAMNLLGIVKLQDRDARGAAMLIEMAVQEQPSNPGFHGNLAQAYLALERVDNALAAFRRAAALDPRNPQFAVGAAVCVAMQGGGAEAERELRKVVQDFPGYALAWYNLGNVLRDAGRPLEAADSYRQATRLDSTFADAYNDLGHVLHRAGRFDDAEQSYRRYLALEPDSTAGYLNLASLLVDRGRFADAVEVCQQGIERFPAPESAPTSELHWILGSALAYQGRLASSRAAFRTAINSAPSNTRALWGYGLALLHTGNEQEALQWLERTRELDPDLPELRNAMAGVYLALGDFQTGWREYEWRPARRLFVQKLSQVELAREPRGDLSGKTVLLLREQGLGDELFFLRFAAELKSRGASITYRANAKIASLLRRLAVLDQVITDDVPPAGAELAVLVGDLPWMLGGLDCSRYRPRTLAYGPLIHEPKRNAGFPRAPRVFFPQVPFPLPLAPLPQKLEEMTRLLAGLGAPPYLGLTWRAGTAPEQQRGIDWVLHKEIALERLGAAVRGVHATLLALQRNPQPGEIKKLSGHAARPVHDLTALNEDLEAMLALLALIDDYIGVSNTNVHLRAGTGRTARVLVPRPAEWRWMISGDESPWFPGFRIYRQGFDGGWDAAFHRLEADLRRQFAFGQ